MPSKSGRRGKMKMKDEYHHFIPRFILRRFQDPTLPYKTRAQRELDRSPEHILVYDMAKGIVEQHDVRNVFGSPNLYRDMNNATHVNVVEEKLSKLECRVASTLNKLHKLPAHTQFTIKRAELNDLRKFLFVQHYRNNKCSDDYFDPEHPENIPVAAWIRHQMAEGKFTTHVEFWVRTLEMYLDKPHGEILLESANCYKKAGGPMEAINSMITGGITPTNELYKWLAYDQQANIYRLGIWEAPDGHEFVMANNSFGLWEGHGEVHRIFVISPRFALVTRSHIAMLNLPNTGASDISSLISITVSPADQTLSEAGRRALTISDYSDEDKYLKLAEYRASKAALEDEFRFTITRLTGSETFLLNQVILDNVRRDGLLTFASVDIMRRTMAHYMGQLRVNSVQFATRSHESLQLMKLNCFLSSHAKVCSPSST